MNIVFDLGGVVFRWQPDEVIAGVFDDARTRDLVRREILGHPDWANLDRGAISAQDVVRRAARRTGISEPDVERLFSAIPVSLTPIDQTIELIRRLSASAHRLFILSNMYPGSIAHLENVHDIWDMFDGIVISCRIGKAKPDVEIYEHLLDTYQLEPAETVFIDDMPENLQVASSLGIRTIRFLDPAQCERELSTLD